MQQWEYKITEPVLGLAGVTEENYLNRMGQEGWQMTGVVEIRHSSGLKFYFKRPLSTADKIFNEVKNEVDFRPGETPFG